MSAPKAMFTASVDMMPALPGGYEFAVGDDVVTACTAAEIMPKVRRLLLKHGISAPAETAVSTARAADMGRAASPCRQGRTQAKPPQDRLSSSLPRGIRAAA